MLNAVSHGTDVRAIPQKYHRNYEVTREKTALRPRLSLQLTSRVTMMRPRRREPYNRGPIQSYSTKELMLSKPLIRRHLLCPQSEFIAARKIASRRAFPAAFG